MKSIPHYKLWIYSVNGAIIALQLSFLAGVALLAIQPALRLFQLHVLDACLLATYALICLQFSVSGLGVWAVWKSKKRWIRHYWLGSIPLIVADTLLAVMWAFKFRSLHRNFLRLEAGNDGWTSTPGIRPGENSSAPIVGSISDCDTWEWSELTYGCILPALVRSQCAGLMKAERVKSGIKCTVFLLRWLHSRCDVLAFLLYFLIYPLKLVVAIVLRDDVIELTSEINYTGNRQRYRHWASADSEDEDMSCENYSCASLSSPRASGGGDEETEKYNCTTHTGVLQLFRK